MNISDKIKFIISKYLPYIVFGLYLISLTILYNTYFFAIIVCPGTIIQDLLFIPIFNYNLRVNFILNYILILLIVLTGAFYAKRINDYLLRFFRGLKFFGPLLQHYTVFSLIICLITPLLFNHNCYQKAVIFNGDFLIIPLIITVIVGRLLLRFQTNKSPTYSREFIDEEYPIKSIDNDLLNSENLIDGLFTEISSNGNDHYGKVIGLIGKWGSGKTSLFNLVKDKYNIRRISTESARLRQFLFIEFNVLKVDDYSKLHLYFLDELIKSIQRITLLPRLDRGVLMNYIFTFLFKGSNGYELLNRIIPFSRYDEYLRTISEWFIKIDITVVILIDDSDRVHEINDYSQIIKLLNMIRVNMRNLIVIFPTVPESLSNFAIFESGK